MVLRLLYVFSASICPLPRMGASSFRRYYCYQMVRSLVNEGSQAMRNKSAQKACAGLSFWYTNSLLFPGVVKSPCLTCMTDPLRKFCEFVLHASLRVVYQKYEARDLQALSVGEPSVPRLLLSRSRKSFHPHRTACSYCDHRDPRRHAPPGFVQQQGKGTTRFLHQQHPSVDHWHSPLL